MGLLQSNRPLLVEAARDHGKSFVFSYAWPLFHLQKSRPPVEPIFIALVSYAEEQARKNLARIRKAIESKDELRWLMPKSKAYVWDAGMLNCSTDSTIEAMGFGSSVRGGHYHQIIIDDPQKDHWTISVQEQENFLFGVLFPALRKNGQLVICGNPVGKTDMMERIEANQEFRVFKYPAINEKGEALWPDQWPLDALDAKRRTMPTHFWAREYMLKRISSEDARFKEEWFKYYTNEDIARRALYKVMTIDPAISPGGDALAAVVTGTDYEDKTYVLDRFSFRGDFKTGVSHLCDMILRHSPINFIGFESFAFQKMYKIWLEEEISRRGIPAFIQETGRDSKKTKAMRIEALQPKIASGKLFFKRDEHKPLIDQFLLWEPLTRTNEDDELDALAWQVSLWRKPHEDYVEANECLRHGTFAAALDEISSGDESWMTRLFEDLANA